MNKLYGKPIRFCRWGGLSSVNQKGYNPSMPTFHSPPCRRGIYAFVWPYIDLFLLTGGFDNNHKWNKEGTEDSCLQKPRIFDYNGELWHHLGEHLSPTKHLCVKGSWYKTSFNDYIKALRKCFHSMVSINFNCDRILKNPEKKNWCVWYMTNNPTIGYTKDELEVFIEKV